MNRNTLAQDEATMFTVAGNPMPLSLPIGSAIFVYLGQVWITQEGMREDVILRPGERFTVRSGALIVASAIEVLRASTWRTRPRPPHQSTVRCSHSCAVARGVCKPSSSIESHKRHASGFYPRLPPFTLMSAGVSNIWRRH